MTTRELIMLNEGRKNKAYLDTKGIPTIGVGHNMSARPLPEDIQDYYNAHGIITEAMIDRLLTSDMEMATFDVMELYPDFRDYSQNRQAALIDLLFNMGITKMREFVNTNLAINEQRWEDAAKGLEKSKYYRQVPNRAKRIIELIRKG